jgi:hypothetical protein
MVRDAIMKGYSYAELVTSLYVGISFNCSWDILAKGLGRRFKSVSQMHFVVSFLLLAAFIWVAETHMLHLPCSKTGRRFKTFPFLLCLKMKEH